ncbi:cob(I)yrinic acid a,c-diamide adenosyltransferase [Candidatus Peribacteria bacterium]|nr:cob(I)yrinic acid a,c-diamide adenosyltransferase [Candidatus Peribacteria bacterium]
MSIVTKTGDRGTTGIFGGERLPKHSPRIEAVGTVDELNAALGVAIATPGIHEELRDQLIVLQHALFRLGGDLATPIVKKSKQDRIASDHVVVLEEWITTLESSLEPQRAFILPGGSPLAARLHLARTICRRAERRVSALMTVEPLNPAVQVYLNRLSDYFFLAAREANRAAGMPDVEVQY